VWTPALPPFLPPLTSSTHARVRDMSKLPLKKRAVPGARGCQNLWKTWIRPLSRSNVKAIMQVIHNNPSSAQRASRYLKKLGKSPSGSQSSVAEQTSFFEFLTPQVPLERCTPQSGGTIKGRTEEPPHLDATMLVHLMTLATCQPRTRLLLSVADCFAIR
jgi:hypothetical protein